MKKGVVKFFNPVSKFGFIISEEDKQEYYFHIKNTDYPVKAGDPVRFELETTKRGLQAVKVSKGI